ncbi:MAG TPA: iron ABC transporter permease [Beijerinckiaceae bacterium]|nr:iron ABC transporter permease [Beijerinckiaceae bacterium]
MLVWGAIIALVVLVALPLAFVVLQAIFPNLGQGSLSEPFGRVLATLNDPQLFGLTANTLLLGVGVVAGTTLLGVPLGMLRALYRVPLATLFDVVLLVPFMIPPYIATLGWIMMLQRRGYLSQIVGFDAASLLYSAFGVVFVMSMNLFPIVYFAVSRTVEAIGGRYADVSRVFGATPLKAFARITFPLSLPGLVASLLIVFALTIEEYGTPAVLGRQSGFNVLVTAIELRVTDYPVDLPGAAILSVLLILLALAAFFVQARILAKRSFQTMGGTPQANAKRGLGIWSIPALLLFTLVSGLAVGVPLFSIFATALSRTLSGGLATSNVSLDHFRAIGTDENGALSALVNSLTLAVGTAAVTGLVGAIAAYAVVRARFRGKALFDALTVMPGAVPGVVVAVGIILCWNQPALPFTPYNTPLILLFAYSCILLPYPVRYAGAAFRQIGDNLEAAARVSGASPARAFRRILLPLILPSLVSAMLLVFAVASRELVASVIVAPVGMSTVATFIWRQFEQGSVGLGMAMSGIAILLTTALPLIATLISRGRGMFG